MTFGERMKPSDSHKIFFDQKSFHPRVVNGDIFTKEEVALLRRFGAWMEALDQKKILPESSEQSAFVEMCSGLREPQTKFELVWWKLKERRKFESEWVCPDPKNVRKAMMNTFDRSDDWWSNADRA